MTTCRHNNTHATCVMCSSLGLCVHGDIRAACLECLETTPPGPPPATEKPVAETWMLARFESRCGHDPAHAIEVGDPIGLVDGEWWCEGCADRPSVMRDDFRSTGTEDYVDERG